MSFAVLLYDDPAHSHLVQSVAALAEHLYVLAERGLRKETDCAERVPMPTLLAYDLDEYLH
jgi:hypothetical protein